MYRLLTYLTTGQLSRDPDDDKGRLLIYSIIETHFEVVSMHNDCLLATLARLFVATALICRYLSRDTSTYGGAERQDIQCVPTYTAFDNNGGPNIEATAFHEQAAKLMRQVFAITCSK